MSALARRVATRDQTNRATERAAQRETERRRREYLEQLETERPDHPAQLANAARIEQAAWAREQEIRERWKRELRHEWGMD
jgi:hypothetical protein